MQLSHDATSVDIDEWPPVDRLLIARVVLPKRYPALDQAFPAHLLQPPDDTILKVVIYPSLKDLGFLSQRPAPTVTIGLTGSPQAFCVSA